MLLSAFLYSLAFPPLSWRPVAWVCLVPLFLGLSRLGALGSALLAAVWAEVASGFVADALPHAVSTYFLQPVWVGWLFAIFIWLVTGSVYYAVFGWLHHGLRRQPRLARPLLVAAAWTACELARGRLFTQPSIFVGNPWALFGYSQSDFLPLVQIASWTGIYGVSFVLVAANAALAELVEAWREGTMARRTVVGLLGQGALPAAVAVAYGGVVLLGAPKPAEAGGAPVLLVQGDVDLGSRWKSEFYGRNLETYLKLTTQGLSELPTRLVVWPEGALTFFLGEEPAYRARIAGTLSAFGAELLVGGPAHQRASRGVGPPVDHYFNSTFLLTPDGGLYGRYDKRHLVPFSEYFPFAGVDLLRRRFERVRVFDRGTRNAPLETKLGPAGILICNEAMLPEVAAERVRAGATFLVNPSNDGWISEPAWAELMFDMVSMRAVEQRRTLLRASTSGPSGIVDAWGRVRARTPEGAPGLVLGALTPERNLSVYARVGDLFGFACAAAALLAALGGRRKSRTNPSRAMPESNA